MTYRLVAIDLDGTLLRSSDRTISPGNAAAIRHLVAQSVRVVLASGRRYATIAQYARGLALPPASPIIAYNGALVRTLSGETRLHQPLSTAAAESIVRFCAAHSYHLNYYWNDELYVREENHWTRLYQERTGTVPQVTHDLTRLDGRRPTKLLIIDTLAVTDRLCRHFQHEFGDSLYITKTEDEYLEFMDPAVNKGAALARVADTLGLGPQDCVAFGDSFNDIPMFQWVGLPVAMGNARPAVKAVAARIAPAADDDGVGRTLGELFPETAGGNEAVILECGESAGANSEP